MIKAEAGLNKLADLLANRLFRLAVSHVSRFACRQSFILSAIRIKSANELARIFRMI